MMTSSHRISTQDFKACKHCKTTHQQALLYEAVAIDEGCDPQIDPTTDSLTWREQPWQCPLANKQSLQGMPIGPILTQHSTGQGLGRTQVHTTCSHHDHHHHHHHHHTSRVVPTAALSVDRVLVSAPAAQYTRHRQA
jgi:hypothetical protein